MVAGIMKLIKLKQNNEGHIMGKTPIQNQLQGAINAVTSANKVDMVRYLIPQRLEGGKLYNFKNVCIGQFDAEDQEFHPVEFEEPARVTAAFMKRMTDPIKRLLDDVTVEAADADTDVESGEEAEEAKSIEDAEEVAEPKKDKKEKKSKDSKPIEDEGTKKAKLMVGEIKALLEKGDKKSIKKAKKAFEEQFAEDHPQYDELAKAIKKAKKALK